jgi:hypothetical protein
MILANRACFLIKGKGKVAPFHDTKAYRENISTYPFPLRQMEASVQRHALVALSQRNDNPTHRIEGWLGPAATLDGFGERKFSVPTKF